jgi:hypothetical protein
LMEHSNNMARNNMPPKEQAAQKTLQALVF